MNKTDINRILIEATVRRTLNRLHESPERETRNLVDMGLNFSRGRFQKKILTTAQQMLQNTKSAYYALIKRAVSNVDQERLLTFGMNLGYDSYTKGAKTIREIEAERHFNIPWALNLVINEKKLLTEPDFYPALLEQGEALGIYTYLLSAKKVSPLIPLLNSQPNCAFLLFLHGQQITNSLLKELEPIKNIMICVYADEDMPAACQKLREAKYLYAVYNQYVPKETKQILNGEWLEKVITCQPLFAFLLADSSCNEQTQKEIYSYILSVRDGQQYPLLFMDLKQDMLMIDQVISDDICLAGFDESGNLRTLKGLTQEKKHNIFYNRLEDILRDVMAKTTSSISIGQH